MKAKDREDRLRSQIGNLVSHKLLFDELRILRTDCLEAYGPEEAKRIDRLAALARRAAGQNVLILPVERILDYKLDPNK